jgi:hypothetical protein
MPHLFDFDPAEILGVAHGARLEEVREAYRAKTKKHHPDAGGDAWAFRLVNRAYELLCCSRVASRLVEEERPDQPPRHPGTEPEPEPTQTAANDDEVHRTIADSGYPDDRLVAVDILILRHEIDNPIDFLFSPSSARNLSCSISATWPIADRTTLADRDRRQAVETVQGALRKAARAVKPGAQRLHKEPGRFSGWLTYDSAREAHEAANRLRLALREGGYGLVLTTRELVVPRA